jgi:hypothetical protein
MAASARPIWSGSYCSSNHKARRLIRITRVGEAVRPESRPRSGRTHLPPRLAVRRLRRTRADKGSCGRLPGSLAAAASVEPGEPCPCGRLLPASCVPGAQAPEHDHEAPWLRTQDLLALRARKHSGCPAGKRGLLPVPGGLTGGQARRTFRSAGECTRGGTG